MIRFQTRNRLQLAGFHRKGSAIKLFELAALPCGQAGEHEAGNFSGCFREIHRDVLPRTVCNAIFLCSLVRYGGNAGWHLRYAASRGPMRLRTNLRSAPVGGGRHGPPLTRLRSGAALPAGARY